MPAASDTKTVSKALGDILAAARKAPISFAMLAAKDGMVIEAQKMKSIDAVKKAARTAGGGPRGAWGMMQVQGGKVVFDCLEPPPSGFDRDARKHFATFGHVVQVEVRVANANAPATDAADATAPTQEPAPAPTSAPATAPATTAADQPQRQEADEEAEEEIADLLALLRAAKKKPVNFAWLVGEEGLVLQAHRRKPVEVLWRQARKTGGGTRGARGVLSIEGPLVVLTCEEAPPKAFARKARGALTELGLKHRVEIRTPTGIFEPEQEGEGADPATAAAEAQPGPDRHRRRSRLSEIETSVDALLADFA